MDWSNIIIATLGSTQVATVIGLFLNRRKNDAEAKRIKYEAEEIYVKHIEKRLNILTERMDLYEIREIIEQSAINCAHKCHIPDSECPVLMYLESHPMPSMASRKLIDKEETEA